MEKSPFSGTGAGKNQLSGDHEISHFKENTGPATKSSKHSKSHPSPGGKTEGPSGDMGVGNWKP